MNKVSKLFFATLFVWVGTFILIMYGFMFHDSDIFFMGDTIGIFSSAMMYGLYMGEYNEYFK